MSPEANLLQTNELRGYAPGLMGVRSDQARMRVREEMDRQKLSQREVADLLKWSQSRVAKNLTGRVELTVDDLADLCFAVNLSIVEAVRDQGMEFCADMTPSELRMLRLVRQLPTSLVKSLMELLDVHSSKTRIEQRHARPLKKNIPKGRG